MLPSSLRQAKQLPIQRQITASVARITEIIAASDKGFDDAVEKCVERACKTFNKAQGAWVQDPKVTVTDGKIGEHRVTPKVTFVPDN